MTVYGVYELPQPPTVNQMYSGRRLKTARYKTWIDEAGWTLVAQRPPPMRANYMLTIWTPSKADIDNVVKATSDLLQNLGLVEDDRLMVELRVVRAPGKFRFQLEPR